MSKRKGVKTASKHLNWDTATNLLRKLERDGDYKFYALIGISIFCGTRISDTLSLRFCQLINQDKLELKEKKTGKHRVIGINKDLQTIIQKAHAGINPKSDNELIFLNKYGDKAYSVQYVNWKLKQIAKKYGINNDLKSHSLRKTFARKIYLMEPTERTLIMLSQLFGHKDVSTTRIYISIQEEEIRSYYDLLSMI